MHNTHSILKQTNNVRIYASYIYASNYIANNALRVVYDCTFLRHAILYYMFSLVTFIFTHYFMFIKYTLALRVLAIDTDMADIAERQRNTCYNNFSLLFIHLPLLPGQTTLITSTHTFTRISINRSEASAMYTNNRKVIKIISKKGNIL